ncbi:MAG: sodium:calcium antiporter [Planctomycetota bacterium]|jgi:cation:H+ antiporter
MNITLALMLLIGGLAVLWKSAELLVAGAVGLARRLGISSLVIGLTVVAMGTSAPELAASIAGVLRKTGEVEARAVELETQARIDELDEQIRSVTVQARSEADRLTATREAILKDSEARVKELRAEGGNLAIGNVFGSNIANLALVGGLVALIQPLMVKRQTLLREIPVMILMELLLWPFLCNSHLSRLEAFALMIVFSVLILITIHLARKESIQNRIKQVLPQGLETDENKDAEVLDQAEPDGIKRRDGVKDLLFIVIGLIGLAVGAKMAVEGAVFIGTEIGLSTGVIALTIIAFGTSLPELVTCVVATVKGHHDISVGNLVGSNIFNTLLVVGGAGIVKPFDITRRFAGGTDYWIMVAIGVAFALAVIIGRRIINRLSGILLLCGYFGYLVYLFGYSG